eukprot:TRINITY_DN27403_c0_g1_i1.p1 TRINITY_DN27403_c0_g1~~TRINITY_DN27403_c0_g1_i1.p1  ORF type:complete len:421 (+),score=87.37 TRINITY_DN27403_c0_g1_i1:70-1263(+)
MVTPARLDRLESKVDQILKLVIQLSDDKEKEWISAPTRSDSEVKYVNAHTELLERHNGGRVQTQLHDYKRRIEKLSEDCRRSTTLTPQREVTNTAQHFSSIHSEVPPRSGTASTPPELLLRSRDVADQVSSFDSVPISRKLSNTVPLDANSTFTKRSDSFKELQHVTNKNKAEELIINSDNLRKEITRARRALNDSGGDNTILKDEPLSVVSEASSAMRLHVSPARKRFHAENIVTNTTPIWTPCGGHRSSLIIDGDLALNQDISELGTSSTVRFSSPLVEGDALTFSLACKNPKTCITITSPEHSLLLTSSGHHNGEPNNKLFPLLSDSPLPIIITRTSAAVTLRVIGTMCGPKWLLTSQAPLLLKVELYPMDSVTFQKATVPQLISPGGGGGGGD